MVVHKKLQTLKGGDNMDRTKLLIAGVGIACVFFIVTVAANPQTGHTPLYTFRMEQHSNDMSFLPTVVNGFTYTTEKGYEVTGYTMGGAGIQDLITIEVTCGTCQNTCEQTCPNTCTPTCEETCPDTCPLTCFNTCPITCETCGPSCGGTCGGTCDTCANTCESSCSTCHVTCDTCDSTCEYTCSTCEETCSTCYITCGFTCNPTCDGITCVSCQHTCYTFTC